ncbi:MAG: DUF4392 domain-containing protein [Mycobacterium leprae]
MERLERLIAHDPGGRGVAGLQSPGDLERAAGLLRNATRVLILTGFPVGPDGVAETDGPPGALFLGRALIRRGKQVVFATHRSCAAVMAAGIAHLGLSAALEAFAPGEAPDGVLARFEPDLIVAVELPGRGRDGQYYNMRGQPITGRTAPLDGLLLPTGCGRVPTIGVGDGGNEAGMGKVIEHVRRHVPGGERIGSVVPADCLIAAGTSNWGAYGLVAALDPALLHDAGEESGLLQALVAAGCCDGVRLEPTCSVDGLELAAYTGILAELKQ